MATQTQSKAEFFRSFARRNGAGDLADAVALAASGEAFATMALLRDFWYDADKIDDNTLDALRRAGFTVAPSKDGKVDISAKPEARAEVKRLVDAAEKAWEDEQVDEPAPSSGDPKVDKTEADAKDLEELGEKVESGDMTFEDALAEIASQEGEETPRAPIGVPDDYLAPTLGIDPQSEEAKRRRSMQAQYGRSDAQLGIGPAPRVKPRYFTGDEWRVPVGLREDLRGKLKAQLIEAGYLKEGVSRGTMWDQQAAAAFQELLADANATGGYWKATLRQAVQQAQNDPAFKDRLSGKEPRPPLIYELPDPGELGLVAERVSMEVLGRRFTDAERQAFVDTYTAQERARQEQVYELSVGEMAGTAYQSVDPTSAAELYARQTAPAEWEAQGAADLYTQLLNFIGVSYG